MNTSRFANQQQEQTLQTIRNAERVAYERVKSTWAEYAKAMDEWSEVTEILRIMQENGDSFYYADTNKRAN